MRFFNCYQCDTVAHLFADSRCAKCTRVDPETGSLPPEDEESDDANVLDSL